MCSVCNTNSDPDDLHREGPMLTFSFTRQELWDKMDDQMNHEI